MPNFETVRSQFPITQTSVFLNHAAAGPIPLMARDAVCDLLTDHAENGVTNHDSWLRDHARVRRQVAALVSGSSEAVAFVQNTSSGLSLAANGIRWKPGDNVVIPACEFPSNVYPWMNLEHLGVELRRVESALGFATPDDIGAAIDGRTRAVSMSFVQFSNGHRNQLASVGEICRQRGPLFVVDGTQGVGALKLNVADCGIDVLAVSGHKWMLSPFGIGFVHCSRRALDELRVSVVGWLSVKQPFEFRYELDLPEDATRFEAGTHNAGGIIGLGASIELMEQLGQSRIEEQVLRLTDTLCDGLLSRGCTIHSCRKPDTRSGIVVFTSEQHDTESLYQRLYADGIVCSIRSGGIRISPHYYNNEAEIERVIDLLK